MKYLNKFVTKIQAAFAGLAIISTIIIAVILVIINSLNNKKTSIYEEYLAPSKKIEQISNSFREMQFILMKFSVPAFAADIQKNIQSIQSYKEQIDNIYSETEKECKDEEVKAVLVSFSEIWKNYKNVVVDATLSAAALQDFEMAAIIATSSGEESGKQMNEQFSKIKEILERKSDNLKDSFTANSNFALTVGIIGAVLGILVLLFSVYKLAPSLAKPLKIMNYAVSEFSIGNYDVDINIQTKDEFGEVALSLRKLRENQQEKIKAAEKIAEGVFEEVVPASDNDKLSFAFNKEVQALKSLLDETSVIIKENKEGNTSVRGNANNFRGNWKEFINGFNETLDIVLQPIKEGVQILDKLSQGDLTARVEGQYKGDHQLIKDSINKTAESLGNAMEEVREAVSSTASAAAQISSSAEEMAAGTQEQSAQTSEIAESIESVTRTIVNNTRNASMAVDAAKLSKEKAENGGAVVNKTIEGMNRIAEVVKNSAETVFTLGQNSDKIGEIIQVIDDIADQTNLLALNAAIEAARAGEQGRGFAVVADEVRKLAERTTKATKEIATMIKQIQQDTVQAVDSMRKGTKEVEEGKLLAVEAGRVLSELVVGSQKVATIIVQVAEASEDQASSSEQISKNIEGISSVTSQTSTGINQIARAAEDLNRLTVNLKDLVEQFKTEPGSYGTQRSKNRKLIGI